eukprot:CAMPEP_0177666944 /NCGR_PEP_ID=MMETSP0447-20121125/21852_1 /TAXON_ID=0 /ORGANISM="Stygamoeba regulata, Strain BSH-02190019" /LENGTH=232 /DNA_ID=CAMNT_0019173127 /DNA_START=273 /DNA_END=972 /DNA_ORIENTATION=-
MSQSETTSKHFDGEVAAFFRKLLEDTKEDSTDIDHEVRTGEESNLCAYNFGFATEQLSLMTLLHGAPPSDRRTGVLLVDLVDLVDHVDLVELVVVGHVHLVGVVAVVCGVVCGVLMGSDAFADLVHVMLTSAARLSSISTESTRGATTSTWKFIMANLLQSLHRLDVRRESLIGLLRRNNRHNAGRKLVCRGWGSVWGACVNGRRTVCHKQDCEQKNDKELSQERATWRADA